MSCAVIEYQTAHELRIAVCPVLHLVLGPLNLNLLGLHVHLNQVNLNIAAVSGPGNLLGNLLCSVANLLNGGVPLPASVVQAVEDALGATPVYRDIDYRESAFPHSVLSGLMMDVVVWRGAVKLATILPWIAFLFGLTSTVLTLMSARSSPPVVRVSEDSSVEQVLSEKRVGVSTKEAQV